MASRTRTVQFAQPGVADSAYQPLTDWATKHEPDSTVVLFDARHAAYRAFHTRDLSAPDGAPTSVLHGLLSMGCATCSAARTTKAIFVWDGGVGYKRKAHPAYKSRHSRPRTAEEMLAAQQAEEAMNIGVQGLGMLGVLQVRWPMLEADDGIGLLSHAFEILADQPDATIKRVLIVSDDHDYGQLLSPRVTLWRGIKSQIVTPQSFEAAQGFPVSRYVSFKALVGESESGDNIPGVTGVGEVTAAKLVATHGSLGAILAHCKALATSGGKCRVVERNIYQQRNNAILSYALSKITRTLADCEAWKFNAAEMDEIESIRNNAIVQALSADRREVTMKELMHLRGRLGFAKLDPARLRDGLGVRLPKSIQP